MISDTYPGIKRAAIEIALDNGGINRDRSMSQMLADFGNWLEDQDQAILPSIDAWLTDLSEDDLSTVCCGEHSDMQRLIKSAPPGTDDLLNRYFDEVC